MFPRYLTWPQKSYMSLDIFVAVNKEGFSPRKLIGLPVGHYIDTTLKKAFVYC